MGGLAFPRCAVPTRGVRDRALREHRESPGLPSSLFTLFPLALEGHFAFFMHSRGGGPMVLDCARRTRPSSGRAFREQKGLSGHPLAALDPPPPPPVQYPLLWLTPWLSGSFFSLSW